MNNALFYSLTAVVLVFLAVVFLVLLIIAMRERLYLSGDLEPAHEPYSYPPVPYWRVTCDNARRLGMQHQGDFVTRKNTSIVKGLQSMWVTQNRNVVAAICIGSYGMLRSKKTVLRTRLQNGVILESCDEGGTVDVGNTIQRAVLIRAGIEELMSFHLQRIAGSGSFAIPFTGNSMLAEYEKMDLEKGERMVQLGLARWVDAQKTSIRMTFRGALMKINEGFIQEPKRLAAAGAG